MNFEERGYSLESLGVVGYAYHYHDVLLYLDWIEENNIVVLGGDVYDVHDGTVDRTYDQWCYNPDHTEADSKESITVAKQYMNRYVKRNGVQFYFTLVLANDKIHI